MGPRIAAASALVAAAAVAAGAFGAHALAERLAERELELWETATRYLLVASLGALAMALHAGRASMVGTIAVLVGGAWFAVTLYGLALGGPRWLGALTPIGGAAMILGFIAFAASVWRGEGAG